MSGVRKLAGETSELVASNSPPDLVMIRPCDECEFQERCRQKAIEQDDLSLLAGMTATERKKFRSKGIFTKPRRSSSPRSC